MTFAVNKYTVTVQPSGHGTVRIDKEEVEHGGSVRMTIIPDNDFQVMSVKIGDVLYTEISEEQGFIEDEEGNIRFEITNITENIEITVQFAEMDSLEESWNQFISIHSATGEGPIKNSFIEGSGEAYVFSKDAKVEITPQSPYKRLKINNGWWLNKYTYNEPVKIKDLKVREFLWKSVNVRLPEPIYILFDTVAPVVGKPEAEEGKWHNKKVTVTGYIDNKKQEYQGILYSTDIEAVYYKQGSYKKGDEGLPAVYDAKTGKYSFDTVDSDYDGKYSIWAVDKAGNMSEVRKINMKIDKTPPGLIEGKKAVTFEQKNDNGIAKVLNFLSFGTFFNKQIKITVQARDEGSGIGEIRLETSDNSIKPEYVPGSFKRNGKTARAEFTLDAETFEGSFRVIIKDRAGNVQTVPVTTENSNIEDKTSGIVMIEKMPLSLIWKWTKDGNTTGNINRVET